MRSISRVDVFYISIPYSTGSEQQSELSDYVKQMTEGGHLTFGKHELRNQVRIQFTNPSSPYFYRDSYSPDIRLFLRSKNYEEGFAKLLAFVRQAKQGNLPDDAPSGNGQSQAALAVDAAPPPGIK